jgi:hypothetical protein
MSLSGSVSRSLTLFGVRWERTLSEESAKLNPGWSVTVELPFIDIAVESYGWSPIFNAYLSSNLVTAFGKVLSWERNTNDFSMEYHGDAEMLEPDHGARYTGVYDGYYTD